MNLYWVFTDDHHEDWFMVANSVGEAMMLHEDLEGYECGEAYAQEVMEISSAIKVGPGWPSEEVLKACGAIFVSSETPRVVKIAGTTYCEGLLELTVRIKDDNSFEGRDGDRPNQTERQPERLD